MTLLPASLLLVDDEPVLGSLVNRLCRKTPWSVAVCLDAASAWERLRSQAFDLVLLDLNLPREPGDQLCRRVRAEPALADLPVALFTDWGVPGPLLAGLDAGADFVVAKEVVTRPDDWPIRIGEILDRVRRPRPWFPPRQPVRAPGAGTGGSDALARALRHPSLRGLPAEVLVWALGRSWAAVLTSPVPENLDGWLVPGNPTLSLPTEDSAVLALALAERLWCLLGTPASAPVRAALAETFPQVSELLQP